MKIDPLKYLLSKATLMGRLAKWMMILSKFDIQYVKRKEIKGQAIADQLAKFPISDHAPMQIDFPDSLVLYITNRTWKMFFDGSHTQNGAGAGIFFVTPHGYTIPKSYKLLFPCTINMDKYEALLNGIKLALEWRITELHISGDSQLVINQVNNDYKKKMTNWFLIRNWLIHLGITSHFLLLNKFLELRTRVQMLWPP